MPWWLWVLLIACVTCYFAAFAAFAVWLDDLSKQAAKDKATVTLGLIKRGQ